LNLDPDGGVKDLRFLGVIALSFGWTNLFATPMMAAAWGAALALAGGPLLWRLLNYQPVTRRALLRAAWTFVATGCWITFGTGAINAYEHGLISLPMSIFAVAVLFAVVAGGSRLIERWYPERAPP
jgi:hypothetical protein